MFFSLDFAKFGGDVKPNIITKIAGVLKGNYAGCWLHNFFLSINIMEKSVMHLIFLL